MPDEFDRFIGKGMPIVESMRRAMASITAAVADLESRRGMDLRARQWTAAGHLADLAISITSMKGPAFDGGERGDVFTELISVRNAVQIEKLLSPRGTWTPLESESPAIGAIANVQASTLRFVEELILAFGIDGGLGIAARAWNASFQLWCLSISIAVGSGDAFNDDFRVSAFRNLIAVADEIQRFKPEYLSCKEVESIVRDMEL